MRKLTWQAVVLPALIIVTALASDTVMAKKPSWAGGQGAPQNTNPQKPDKMPAKQGTHFFNQRHKAAVQEYYAKQYKGGKCPPGLAKKQNGCMPPGQAKKWAIGRPLPPDVDYRNLPQAVLADLGPPPPQHQFVRVAQDILLVATGTRMVVDAIEDLNWQFNR